MYMKREPPGSHFSSSLLASFHSCHLITDSHLYSKVGLSRQNL